MSRHDAPPETDVQRQAREWWTARLGACAVGWGRDRHGKFLSEFARNAEAAWAAALNTRAASGGECKYQDDPTAWLIQYRNPQSRSIRKVVYLHNAVADFRDLDRKATSTPLYAKVEAAQVVPEPSIDGARKSWKP